MNSTAMSRQFRNTQIMSWCTIESDPGVFTELIADIGVKGVQVEELCSLDHDSMSRLKPIFGLIFLFKWRRENDPRPAVEDADNIFFAKQMIENACATQAIINCLLNRPEIDVGPELTAYREFTSALPADLRGLALDEVSRVRTAHNSFARPEPFVSEEKRSSSSSDDDAFHFITYVPINGNIYELDGLKPGPILLEACTDDDWLDKAAVHIQARIQRYSQSEIRFNLMAIIKNRQEHLNERLLSLEKQRHAIQSKLTNPLSESAEPDIESQELLHQIDSDISDVRSDIADEEAKFRKWKVENTRRRFNYIPFIFNFLKVLAEKNQLMPLVEAGVKKQSHEMNKK